MSEAFHWRRAAEPDLDAIMAIQDEVHAAFLPESRDIFIDKQTHFGDGFLVLDRSEHDVARKPLPTFRHPAPGHGRPLGYGIAHPWRLGTVPKLDTPFGRLPDAPDCLFIHDVALLPEARGQGAGSAFVRIAREMALPLGIDALALVSVYGTVPMWERCGFGIETLAFASEHLAGYGKTARYMVNRLGTSLGDPA